MVAILLLREQVGIVGLGQLKMCQKGGLSLAILFAEQVPAFVDRDSSQPTAKAPICVILKRRYLSQHDDEDFLNDIVSFSLGDT